MELFPQLDEESKARGLRFLVIGGLAINYYGYSRDTADLDLLICKEKRADWLQLFLQLKYKVDQDSENFIQFSPPEEGDWPVDLMLVREATFHAMWTDSLEVRMFDVQMRLPSLEHLLALKLHALRYGRPHRFLKDFQDLEGLILENRLDPNSERIRQLFVKYGTLEVHEKIIRSCSGRRE